MAKPRRPARTANKVPSKRPAGPRPSAGPRILKDLGITDAQLAAYLPPGGAGLPRGVLWCQFECGLGLDEIARRFEDRYDVSDDTDLKFPEGGPPGGIEIRQITLLPKGKYVAYSFYGMRGERYVEDGSVQLEASFREMGTAWGSNRAVYERFKQLELPRLGARKIVELTE